MALGPRTAEHPSLMRRRSEHGAAAVEFALVMPILLLLVCGIIDFGLMINAKTVVANAAREGARNGAISRNETVIRQTVTNSLTGIVSGATTTVACKKASGAACAGSFDTQVESGGLVIVTVTSHYSWITPIAGMVGLGNGADLQKTVSMRVE
jgi:Flp pilus assembly protein TadG